MNQSVQFKDLLTSLRKSPNQRSLEDVLTIKNYLMTIQFLKDSFKGQDQSFEQLSKMFRLEIFDEDQTIFHIDSKGEKYYLILQGQVGIYIRPPKQISKGENKLKPQKKKDDIMQENKLDKKKDIRKDADENEECLQFQKNNHLDSLIMVKQLQEGQTFGEMALIYNQPRLATIHTFQETILAVLTKRDFRLIMKKAQMRQIKGELKFLKQIYLFQSWNYENLRDIYLNSEQIQLQIGQNVYKEDDPADSIYIIRKGSFLVQLAKTQQNVDSLIKNQNLLGKIGQLGECDVFGEEEFCSLINLIFKENDCDQNSYFDQQNQQLEQFITENQKINRFSTVTCDCREGGILIRIKINDYLLRILNYSETRKIAINSIKQKIALHSKVHERNCETFVIYQKYLIRGDPQFFKNPLSSLVCQNAIYSNNATIDQSNFQGINSEIKKGISPIHNPIFTETITITKDLKQNSKKSQSSQERNQYGRVSQRGNSKYTNKVKSNENLDDTTVQTSNQVKISSQKQKAKKYKFQFTTEQCDDSIFTEKIPQNIKQIHQERQKQKYESMQIYKYQQTNYQKVKLNHFKNKYNQNVSPQHKQNAIYKSLEPFIQNKIAKLGYKFIKLKDQEIESQSREYYSIEDNYSNQQTQRNEISNLMQITICGDSWINKSVDQRINLNSAQMQQTKNQLRINNQNTGKSKIDNNLQIRECQKIRLRPLITNNQTNSTCKNLNSKNSLNFNNFYNSKLDQRQNGSLTDNVYNNISLQVTPSRNHYKLNNQSLDHKQHLNKSYDIYHPLNLSRERNQNHSRDWKSRQQYVNSFLNEFQSRSISLRKIKLLNCHQIAPITKFQEQNSPQEHQQSPQNKIKLQNKRKEHLFQLKCITEQI
ncbi:hypothetical protein ABPG72_007695 [Tetrahymena utriculariae]